MATELDYMEYATDATAQAAYITSGEYTSDLTGSLSYDCSCYEGAGYSADKAFNDIVAVDFWCTNTCANMGTNHWVGVDFGSGNEKRITKVRFMCSGYGVVNNFKIYGSNTSFTAGRVELYSDTHPDDSNWHDYTFSNNTAYRYYLIFVVDTHDTFITISEAEMMETALQCYSESTLKQQGSYSLKGAAKATSSLNATLTRTVSPTIDLSGLGEIKLDIRASRTGSNIKIGIHDSGGTTTEHTPNIATADTNQTETWNLSAVSNANRDAIDSIIITIVNADADNTFYIDNMYGQAFGINVHDCLDLIEKIGG